MTVRKMASIVFQNVRRNKKHFVFASIGITVGVSVFSFFLALTFGVREEILNKIYPVDLIEVEPSKVNIGGFKSQVGRIAFNNDGVGELQAFEGVTGVYPKLKSKFQATYKLGGQLFGDSGVQFEAFFDGLNDELLRTELREREATRGQTTMDELKIRYGRERKCYDSEDCSPGEECVQGFCKTISYWSQFEDKGEVVPCRDDSVCVAGSGCIQGACRPLCDSTKPDDEPASQETPDSTSADANATSTDATPGTVATCYPGASCTQVACSRDQECGAGGCVSGFCSRSVCLRPCASSSDCPLGTTCAPNSCLNSSQCQSGECIQGTCSLSATCQHIRCQQNSKENEIAANPVLRRGELPGLCEDGTPVPEGGSCPPARCPYGTYCSVSRFFGSVGEFRWDRRGEGYCERPIPAILNPMVLEVFNLVLGSTLEQAQLGSVETLLGYEGSVSYGTSFYKEQVRDRVPAEKRIVVVGFSNKALEAGVTMPIDYVKRANARFKGGEATDDYDSIILQIANAEDLPDVMVKMEKANIELSRRSAEADKFRTILQVAIAIFMIMASIILGIAAINISHTFLMVIFERRREIGILRALGATKMDVRGMFLGESVLIGVTGGLLGNSIAVGMSLVADMLANRYLSDFPFEPESFFFFRPDAMALSFGFAVFFSLLGAFFPANRAASMDPAETLTAS